MDNNWDHWVERIAYWENQLSPVGSIQAEKTAPWTIYSINGTIVRHSPLPPGIYIINGRKTLVTRH